MVVDPASPPSMGTPDIAYQLYRELTRRRRDRIVTTEERPP
jgi:hypothetical protein